MGQQNGGLIHFVQPPVKQLAQGDGDRHGNDQAQSDEDQIIHDGIPSDANEIRRIYEELKVLEAYPGTLNKS